MGWHQWVLVLYCQDSMHSFLSSPQISLWPTAVKIWLELLQELWSYGGFNLRVLAYPNFYRCKNVLDVLYDHAKFGGTEISPTAGVAKNVEYFVCLSVRHAFERQSLCARFRHEGVGARKRFWCRWIGGRFVVVHSCSTFWDWWELATSVNAEVQKRQKTAKLGFSSPQDDRINRSRRNFAGKRTPSVCYVTPYLALIGERGRYRSPKMSKFAKKCGFWPPEADTINTFRWNLACKCRLWICSSSPNLAFTGKRGSIQEPPKCPNLPKLWFLATVSRHNKHIQMKFGL